MNRTILSVLLFVGCAAGADRPRSVAPQEHFLQGYVEKVSGEILSYWSFHPFAKQSLLTRCTTGEMAIAWKTEPLPSTDASDTVSFLWIGAFSTGTSSADHDFDFFINQKRVLTFRVLKGGHFDDWSVPGTNGTRLQYTHVWTDHVDDAHGYFSLHVLRSSFPAGKPLTLKVVGHKDDSRDWYMTFMYAARDSAVIRPLPLLLRADGELRQPIEISVDSPAGQGQLSIGIDGANPKTHSLELGWNPVVVSVPAVARPREVPLMISINNGPARRSTALVKPVRHRTIWLLPHSHNDIGYSDLQSTVLAIQIQNIRDALRIIEKTRDYPEGSRFKWNVEVLWPVDSYLKSAAQEERELFLGAVSRGDIGLNALYINPLTGIARPEALLRMTDFSRELERGYGLKIPAAMVSDIPGFVWSTVPALAQGGVRYFTSGPNAGDRIGHFATAWGDKPFYWVGPSGKDSVLFWVAGTGYSLFHASRGFSSHPRFLQQLPEYLERLDAAAYPYDIVQMRYSIYSDNGMIDSTMSDYVRQWNSAHASPTFRIATAEEMCVAFESQYGPQLPSFAGDITPYWEDGAASTASELGMALRASERLVQAEIVTSMTEPERFDHKPFADAWDNVNLWIEHTWGAWNSVSDPDDPEAVDQWRTKQKFALEADRLSRTLLERQTLSAPSAGFSVFEVINTTTWPRTDVVVLSVEESMKGDRILDQRGDPVLSQRLRDGRLAFLASAVPPLGSLQYTVSAGQSMTDAGVTCREWSLQNELLQVTIDTGNGNIRSIRELSTGRELLSALPAEGFNALIVVQGTDPASRAGVHSVRLRMGEEGPFIASIVAEGGAPGINSAVREVSLIKGLNRVDIFNVIDKQAVREKEAVYFSFDFDIPDVVTRLDLGWGYIRPEQDQLPGSCKDFFSVQRWVDLSNTQRGITLATVEAPLVSLGQLVDERHHNEGPSGWKTGTGSSALVYSWVMNNYWHTNYRADQKGRSSFHYSLKPHGGFDPLEAYRFGVERNQPLIVRPIAAGARSASLPFTLRSSAVTITSISPVVDGRGLTARLYNPTPEESSIEFVATSDVSIAVFESSPRGEKTRALVQPAVLGPFEILTVQIE